MGIKSLVQVAVTLAILAVSTGKLPLILKEVRKAQLVLLEESKASRWGTLRPLSGTKRLVCMPLKINQRTYCATNGLANSNL